MDATTVRVLVYDWILTRGTLPSCAQIGSRLGIPADEVKRGLSALGIGKALLAHPKTGEIWMAGPFGAGPTRYPVHGSRISWWANCAWDMFGVAILASEPVRIDAVCTDCGQATSLRVDPRRGPLEEGCVHFLVPAKRWYDDIRFT